MQFDALLTNFVHASGLHERFGFSFLGGRSATSGDPGRSWRVNIAVLLDGTWGDANTHANIAQTDARVPHRIGGVAQEICYAHTAAEVAEVLLENGLSPGSPRVGAV